MILEGAIRNRGVAVRLVSAALACAVISAQPQDDFADAARLVEVLELTRGSVVADIGAGSGQLTLRMARHVGPAGRVYSTDLNPQRVQDLSAAVTREGLRNVTVLRGRVAGTNLPRACCDALFMRHVYHHIARPADMNASLFDSLKPGGRVAVVDFAPDAGRSSPPGHRDQGAAHGVMPDTVIRELSAAGFVGLEQVAWPSPGYFLVVGRRPGAGQDAAPARVLRKYARSR